MTRGANLFVDETNLFISSRGFDLETIMTPLNGHLIAVERFLMAVDIELGADFLFMKLALIAGGIGAAWAAYALMRPRLGAAIAAPVACLLLLLGSAWEITLIPAGIPNVYCVAGGLGAIWMLERKGRGDIAACLLLLLSVASWSLGVIFAVGVAIVLLGEPERRRSIWVPAVPLGLYAVWYVWAHLSLDLSADPQTFFFDNVFIVPTYLLAQASAVAGTVTGLDYPFDGGFFSEFSTSTGFGPALAVIAAVGIGLGFRRRGFSWLGVAGVTMLLLFWVSLAMNLGTGRGPETVRYAYPSLALLIVIGAEAFRGQRADGRLALVPYILVALALATNLARADDGTRFYRLSSTQETSALAAVEFASGSVAPDFVAGNFPTVEAGKYLDAVDRNGSPAPDEEELLTRSEGDREFADETSIGALGIVLAPPNGASCRGAATASTIPGEEPLDGSVLLRAEAPSDVSIRRFADEGTSLGALAGGRWQPLLLPDDAADRGWTITVTLATDRPARLEICPESQIVAP